MKLPLLISIILLFGCSTSKKYTKRTIVRTDTLESGFYPKDSFYIGVFYDEGYKTFYIKKN